MMEWSIVLLLLWSVLTIGESVEVNTVYGNIRGVKEQVGSNGQSINKFIGIPYVQAPVGKMHFNV